MQLKDHISTEVLIFGTGIAGNAVALELASKKIRTTMVTKAEDIDESNTKYAQGGVIYKGKGDPELLMEDILQAGANFSNYNAVKILAKNGPAIIEKILIKKLGIKFTKDNNGNIHLIKEAAHSCKRIIHIKDCTGKIIEEAFVKDLKRNKFIKFYTNTTLIDLIIIKNKSKRYCVGAYILDNNKNEIKTIFAKKVILATGGVGKLYSRTANSGVATGDGLAAAFRAGAKIKNAEFIQFHPTSLYSKNNSGFLISEALRGEGAQLKNQNGDNFVEKYDKRGGLAPRDIVTRAIFWELTKSRKDYVLLDARSIQKEKIKNHFSNIYKTCLKNGIDITKEPIPVAPTAHYFCGGIKVDTRGRTNIKNLFAIGETSCTGVHGANRLASTSLLECLVWGTRAAKDISVNINKLQIKNINASYLKYPIRNGAINLENDRNLLKNIMWSCVGIIRSKKNLLEALQKISFLHKKAKKIIKGGVNKDIINFYNSAQAALIITKAALNNKQSRGCHYLDKQ